MRKRVDALYQRGGVWWCRVRNRAGRVVRKSTGCKDLDAARIQYQSFEREAVDPQYGAAASATLAECLGDYYADLKRRRVSAATYSIAEQKCGHLVRLWGLHMPMSRITAGLVHEFIDQRQKEDVTDFTIKKELGQVRQLLLLAIHHGKFHLAIERIMPPFFRASPNTRTRTPTLDETRRLFEELEPRRAAHLAYMIATGARLGESIRAHRADTDWQTMTVRLRGTKTEASEGSVPITRLSEPLLRWSLDHAPGKSVLFHPWGKLHRDVAAACVRAGIERVSPNDLRRAFATWHRNAGVDNELVSKLLRHTTDKLVQTTYANIGAAQVGALIEAKLHGVPEKPAGAQDAQDVVSVLKSRGRLTVPDLYPTTAPTAETGSDGATAKDETPRIIANSAAPPARIGLATFGLGNRRRNARSVGNFKAWERRRARATVPNLYPDASSASARAFRAKSWLWLAGAA